MKTSSSKRSPINNDLDLDDLLTTNKTLAQEKRQLHQQKLRQYSEKAVKLKEILRSSVDHSQRKCLESKIKHIQDKQNAEIAKLAKIDQIQQQIDEYMFQDPNHPNQNEQYMAATKDNEEIAFYKKTQEDNEQDLLIENPNTPAKRLRRKSIAVTNKRYDEEKEEIMDSSINSNNMHLSSSLNHIYNFSNKKDRALNPLTINELKIKEKIVETHKNVQEGRSYSFWEGSQKKINDIEEKTYKPKKISVMVTQQNIRDNNKIYNILAERKRQQKNLQQYQQRISQLIQKQRNIMQNIDKLERQESILSKRNLSFVNSIQKSRDIIMSSGLILEQLSQIQGLSKNRQRSAHQFSIDSLQSQNSESMIGLSMELANFERLLQQFLMAAQRETMITSGQLQQSNLRLNRTKQQLVSLETKKKPLQKQYLQLEQSLFTKRKQLKSLDENGNKVKSQLQELQQIRDLKKKLVAELEEKSDKLKIKKKTLAQKIEKAEKQLHYLEDSIHKNRQSLNQLQNHRAVLESQKKEIEQAFIFAERQLQILKDQKRHYKNLEEELKLLQAKVNSAKVNHENILIEISSARKQLVELQSHIAVQNQQQKNIGDRMMKLQKQINEATKIMDEQRCIIGSQNEQINHKANQLLQSQKKIIAISDSHQALEEQKDKVANHIIELKEEIQKLKKESQQIHDAKEELEEILRQVIVKKQALLSEVDLRSNQLETLLGDLTDGHQQLTITNERYSEIQKDLNKLKQQYSTAVDHLQEVKIQLQQKFEEQSNLMSRLKRLKQVQKQLLLQISLKGFSTKLDQELQDRVAQVTCQLQIVNELKSQLKECKYENRRLKLDNQRLEKLVQTASDSSIQ